MSSRPSPAAVLQSGPVAALSVCVHKLLAICAERGSGCEEAYVEQDNTAIELIRLRRPPCAYVMIEGINRKFVIV